MQSKTYEMDMCNGPLFRKILIFAVPLMISGMLQLLFNAADVAIAGRYAGRHALAAVGATGSLVNLMTNVFIGFSVGVNVLVVQFYGAGQDENVNQTVHTAIALSLICGVVLAGVGILLAELFLSWMGTPDDVLGHAALYIRIYFAGMPVILLYNFGSAVLRSVGDTRRPLYYLMAAGVVNVLLNLYFVIEWEMGVAGVALATVLSQCISAGLVVRCLLKAEGSLRLDLKKLKIHKSKMKRIIRTGLPAGLQGSIFSLSNVLIQSSVNSFGSVVMAGNTAASNLEGFAYAGMNAFHHAALCFTGQNLGAGRQDRVGKVLKNCLILATITGLALSGLLLLFREQLLGLYTSDAEVIRYAVLRLSWFLPLFFTCGWMDTMVGTLRGMGYSIMPMIVSTIGACGLRILWIFTIFAWNPTLGTLYVSYPITWFITAVVHMICFYQVRKPYHTAQWEKAGKEKGR